MKTVAALQGKSIKDYAIDRTIGGGAHQGTKRPRRNSNRSSMGSSTPSTSARRRRYSKTPAASRQPGSMPASKDPRRPGQTLVE